MKNLGVALEKYAEDNKGVYPGDLSALVPLYIKEIPSYAPNLTPEDLAFYKEKNIPPPIISYETD